MPRFSLLPVLFFLCLLASPVLAEIDGAAIAASEQDGEWRAYGRSYSEQRFSPLKQINDTNVGDLKLDWFLEMQSRRSRH